MSGWIQAAMQQNTIVINKGDGIESRLPLKIFYNEDRELTKSIDDYGNQLILQLFQKSTSTPYQ